MQIPILKSLYTNSAADIRAAYPLNLQPIIAESDLSKGYLRQGDGIITMGTGPGVDRGGINWKGVCYRAMGTKLVSVSNSGAVTVIGDIGGSNQCTFDYSFDRLGISSNGNLFYWNGSTLTQVTDADIGTVIDFVWVDGYFMTTDGSYLIVTELNDPLSINPLKYGSAEADPDPVKGLLKLKNEVYALNRHTIEVFDNVGGELFPFSRIEGAQIQKGVIGTYGACVFADTIAFLGSGRNESPAIYLGNNSNTEKVSTPEIDRILAWYTEDQLSLVVVEPKTDNGRSLLYVHLPNQCLVYDLETSKGLQTHVWFRLSSGLTSLSQYRAKNFVWCYDKWICGDPTSSNIGYLTDTISSHHGSIVAWEFGTSILYNASAGAVFHELELVALTGRVALGANPQISTSYSKDGETWSQDKWSMVGKIGERLKRIVWFQNGLMNQWRIQRFRGDSQAFISIARLEAKIEPLFY